MLTSSALWSAQNYPRALETRHDVVVISGFLHVFFGDNLQRHLNVKMFSELKHQWLNLQKLTEIQCCEVRSDMLQSENTRTKINEDRVKQGLISPHMFLNSLHLQTVSPILESPRHSKIYTLFLQVLIIIEIGGGVYWPTLNSMCILTMKRKG